MNRPPLTLLAAALLGTALPASALEFKSKAYPYTLNVPDNWQSKKVPGVDVALAAPVVGSAVPPSLNVAVTQVSPSLNVTLGDVRALMLKQAGESVKDLKVLGDADLKVAGLPGHALNYLGSQQNIPMHWVQVFTLRDNVSYILTFAAPQATFDQNKAAANQILNSFKFSAK